MNYLFHLDFYLKLQDYFKYWMKEEKELLILVVDQTIQLVNTERLRRLWEMILYPTNGFSIAFAICLNLNSSNKSLLILGNEFQIYLVTCMKLIISSIGYCIGNLSQRNEVINSEDIKSNHSILQEQLRNILASLYINLDLISKDNFVKRKLSQNQSNFILPMSPHIKKWCDDIMIFMNELRLNIESIKVDELQRVIKEFKSLLDGNNAKVD